MTLNTSAPKTSSNEISEQLAGKTSSNAFSKTQILRDYELGWTSRHISLLGRKEVLTGKAKFGIFGDGKELPQLALAHFFQPGDFRSGYYRDQTLAFATGIAKYSHFFSQLYGTTSTELEPHSAGRQMNCHFGSRLLDENGQWKNQLSQTNSSADISPTGGQMPRLLGLAYASKLYRNEPTLKAQSKGFSQNGNEIAWGTIGDASTSEGIFWETLNAAGVLQTPLVMSVWDDGFGISVPKKFQTTKESISEALSGFQRSEFKPGFEILSARGWNYPELLSTYERASSMAREQHIPVLVHVTEVTQPQGHSTSGSHERYKTKERLAFEEEFCCLKKFKQWILAEKLASLNELDAIETLAFQQAEAAKQSAWSEYVQSIQVDKNRILAETSALANQASPEAKVQIEEAQNQLKNSIGLSRKSVSILLHKTLFALRLEHSKLKIQANEIFRAFEAENNDRFNGLLYSNSSENPLRIPALSPTYSDNPELVDGRIILLNFFDQLFAKDSRFFTLGEDVGKLGDVNLVFEGLNGKYGDLRITDTGIREATILGQGIGAALRGLRPIVDIQYLDYLLYALQIMSDDLATTHFRTAGGQKAPVIIRTKGHRLEGIWHTGSPIGMILNSIKGIYFCVPRNMTQAAGLYATLAQGDNPALVIEVLNGYRLKEQLPNNIGTYQIPLGVPEVLRLGGDVTLVTYGACCRIAEDAAQELQKIGISLEIIDIQTLIPFDIHHSIVESLKKTNALVILDEDVPGGASASILKFILEDQRGFDTLELPPLTITGRDNRTGYGSDADYFSKPSVEDVVRKVYALVRKRNPNTLPAVNL